MKPLNFISFFFLIILGFVNPSHSANLCELSLHIPKTIKTFNIDKDVPKSIEINGQTFVKKSSNDRVEFKDVPIGSKGEPSSPFTFTVPKDAVSISIVIKGDIKNDTSHVYRLTDSNGRELISPNPNVSAELLQQVPRGQFLSINQTIYATTPGLSCTKIPNNPNIKIPSGEWKVEIARDMNLLNDNLKRDIEILIKRSPKALPISNKKILRQLRLNLHFAIGNQQGLPSKFGSNPKSIKKHISEKLLKDFIEAYRKIGINVKIENVFQISRKFNKADFFEGDGPPRPLLQQLIQKSSSNKDQIIDIYFLPQVPRIQHVGFAINGGDAGKAPVIIRESRPPSTTLAHELGHLFGLFHTNMDTLSDTVSPYHILNGNEGQRKNIMDPARPRLEFSPEQIKIIHTSPVLTDYEPVK